ncbi:hypothetical protein [Bremerella sp.]|uniref:hypothetical protein n=1 Tax=Bremerella sp. TaxID=2795602 RepID=UPI00391D6294
MSLRKLVLLIAISTIAVPSYLHSQDRAAADSAAESATDQARESDRRVDAVRVMFSRLDADGDGKLAGAELERLPRALKPQFTEGQEPESMAIDFEQFAEGLEVLKRDTVERFQRERVESDRVVEQRDRTRSNRDTLEAQPNANQPAEAAGPIRRERQSVVRPNVAAAKSFKIEIVMLRRTTDGLPSRTLGSEVSSVLDGAGPSLAARLIPWLADPDTHGTQLVDYMQAQSTSGESIMIQRGGRESYVSSATSMGSRGRSVSYNMENVGTMARIEPFATNDDGKLGVSVQFEKSYLEQPTIHLDDEEEQPENAVSDEAASDGAASGTASRTSRSPANFARGPVSEAVPPPSITTMTAQGKLVLPAGEAGILTEIGKLNGDSYEEVVILVQWN